jgi:phosphomannomutase
MRTNDPFLAYDVRGRLGESIDAELAYTIGKAFSYRFSTKSVVVGRDIRESSPDLSRSLSEGLLDGGSDVMDIGLCGTETVYFATSHLKTDGGIMITASHNPRDYNGMKFVLKGSVPLHKDNGLFDVRDLAFSGKIPKGKRRGDVSNIDVMDPYIEKMLSFVSDRKSIEGMAIATDSGHGCAGPVLDRLAEELKLNVHRIHHTPDGTFPAGVPNPILPEMRREITKAVIDSGSEAGIAWDGDFDRCFMLDENGGFIEGYYMVGLLAKTILKKEPGSRIVHDPRLIWNTVEIVKNGGGIPLMNRTGHAFIKDRMRAENAVYGGEMSAHHYFRDFYYCDTGMVPWLLTLQLMRASKKPLSDLIGEMARKYPVSGEINRKVADPLGTLDRIEKEYSKGAVSVDHTDGVSIEHKEYRFNLRSSNTEPLIRLNVETRGDPDLLQKVTGEILSKMG